MRRRHRRHRDDRRPHVEAEAVLFEHSGLAAEPFVALEEHDPIAARGQNAGCREAAEAAADNADWIVDSCAHVKSGSSSRRRKER